MQRILVLGGAFNPPTLAHQAMIAECLALPGFDRVWLMPSGDRLDKTIVSASDQQRLRMLSLVRREVFADNPRLVVSDFELRLPRPSATYRTVDALEAAHPRLEFWFAFGADSYQSMHAWPNGAQLRQRLQRLVLFTRGTAPTLHPAARVVRLAAPFVHISSTAARQALAEGKDATHLLGPAVLRYAQRDGLYVCTH
jgi:nicotinate-nucleotide adenylyltransferase